MYRLTYLARVSRSVAHVRSTGLALPRQQALLRYNSSASGSGVPPSSSSSKPPTAQPPKDASSAAAEANAATGKAETAKTTAKAKETLSNSASSSKEPAAPRLLEGATSDAAPAATTPSEVLQDVDAMLQDARQKTQSQTPTAQSSTPPSPSQLQASRSNAPKEDEQEEWSVLMRPDELYDSYETYDMPATPGVPAKKGQPAIPARPYRTRVNLINTPSLYPVESEDPEQQSSGAGILDQGDLEADASEKETRKQFNPLKHLTLSQKEIQKLHRFLLIRKRVVQMTGKGKMDSMYVMIVMGNGNGLVGFGEGKASEMSDAILKAQVEAVKNLDYVDRFEGRTLWSDLESKLGATQVLMRPRPVGFGLRCNPFLHQVLKAAGVKDVSAKVWGSRNGMNIIKASIRALHGGNAVLGMGDGVGGPGRRLESKAGMRGRDTLERERGRKLIDARLW